MPQVDRATSGGSLASFPQIEDRADGVISKNILVLGSKTMTNKSGACTKLTKHSTSFPDNVLDLLQMSNIIMELNPINSSMINVSKTEFFQWMNEKAGCSYKYSDMTLVPVEIVNDILQRMNEVDTYHPDSPIADFIFNVLTNDKDAYISTPGAMDIPVNSAVGQLMKCMSPVCISAIDRSDMEIVAGNNTIHTAAIYRGKVLEYENVPIRIRSSRLLGNKYLKTGDCELYLCVAPAPDSYAPNSRSSALSCGIKGRSGKQLLAKRAMLISESIDRNSECKPRIITAEGDTPREIYAYPLCIMYHLVPIGDTVESVHKRIIQKGKENGPRHVTVPQYREFATRHIASVFQIPQGAREYSCSNYIMTELPSYDFNPTSGWEWGCYVLPPKITSTCSSGMLGNSMGPSSSSHSSDSGSGGRSARFYEGDVSSYRSSESPRSKRARYEDIGGSSGFVKPSRFTGSGKSTGYRTHTIPPNTPSREFPPLQQHFPDDVAPNGSSGFTRVIRKPIGVPELPKSRSSGQRSKDSFPDLDYAKADLSMYVSELTLERGIDYYRAASQKQSSDIVNEAVQNHNVTLDDLAGYFTAILSRAVRSMDEFRSEQSYQLDKARSDMYNRVHETMSRLGHNQIASGEDTTDVVNEIINKTFTEIDTLDSDTRKAVDQCLKEVMALLVAARETLKEKLREYNISFDKLFREAMDVTRIANNLQKQLGSMSESSSPVAHKMTKNYKETLERRRQVIISITEGNKYSSNDGHDMITNIDHQIREQLYNFSRELSEKVDKTTSLIENKLRLNAETLKKQYHDKHKDKSSPFDISSYGDPSHTSSPLYSSGDFSKPHSPSTRGAYGYDPSYSFLSQGMENASYGPLSSGRGYNRRSPFMPRAGFIPRGKGTSRHLREQELSERRRGGNFTADETRTTITSPDRSPSMSPSSPNTGVMIIGADDDDDEEPEVVDVSKAGKTDTTESGNTSPSPALAQTHAQGEEETESFSHTTVLNKVETEPKPVPAEPIAPETERTSSTQTHLHSSLPIETVVVGRPAVNTTRGRVKEKGDKGGDKDRSKSCPRGKKRAVTIIQSEETPGDD